MSRVSRLIRCADPRNTVVMLDLPVGTALATRDLMADLRDRGEIRGTNPSFTKQDRIRFLDALENAVQSARRAAG